MELSERAKSFKKGKYEHYKGKLYEALDVAFHSETLEELVVYRPLYLDSKQLWVRPLEMFLEEIELDDGKKVPRFRYISK